MDEKQLKLKAKNYLSEREYSRFKNVLKDYEKSNCIATLCTELLKVVNNTELLVEVRQMLPKNKRSEFSQVCRDLMDKQTKPGKRSCQTEKEFCTEKDDTRKPLKRPKQHGVKPVTDFEIDLHKGDIKKKEVGKLVIMERECVRQDFGFKIQGDLFTQREVIVGEVDSDSIAEKAGLEVGVRIIKINEVYYKRARKYDIIKLIKCVEKLHLRVLCYGHDKGAGNLKKHGIMATNGEHRESNSKKVKVYADEDGLLGCSIRGGSDYACEVHVVSIEDRSPAQRAGLRKGDIISKINGNSLQGKTHVQAVRLILSASPPITFTLNNAVKRDLACMKNRHKDSNQHVNDGLPHTSLRIGRRARRMAETMPFPTFQLPGYSVENEMFQPSRGLVGSPAALPFHALNLKALSPPPPYTAEPPQSHRVIEKGANIGNYGDSSKTDSGNNARTHSNE